MKKTFWFKTVAIKTPFLPAIFLIFFYINSSNKATAQTEWAPVGAKWINEEVRYEESLYILTTYESVKDTYALGKNCKKILTYRYSHERVSPYPPYNLKKDSSIIFMFSENNRFYYSNGDSFILLYDLSLKAKDTFYTYQRSKNINEDSFRMNRYLIDSVNNINISGKILKRQYLHPLDSMTYSTKYFFYDGYIIEKIGYYYYMFGSYWMFYDNIPPKLKCYSDGEIFYQDTNFMNCNGFEAISDTRKTQEFQIYPNPAKDKIYINSSIKQNLKILVYNTMGQCMLQRALNTQTNEIDISSLTKGIYILKLTNSNGTIEKKIIKE